MTKREISAVLARASKEEVEAIAEEIKKSCEIQIIKEPQKTLVMVKARESIQKSLFYLGEVLASECMVLVDGCKGMNVMAGDDFEKNLCAAIIDGYLNGQKKNQDTVLKQVELLGTKQALVRAKMNREIQKSKVNFNVMGE